MSVARQTGQTVVALLNTVNTVAQQATRTVNIAATGLDMLDTTVQNARIKQVARTEVDQHLFFTQLHEDTAMDISRRQLELTKELNADENLKEIYKVNHSNLDAVMQRINSKLGR